MGSQNDKLLKLFSRLDRRDREFLLAFAEFLASRAGGLEHPSLDAPREIPRPEAETVIEAVRRLSETYPMVDKGQVLHETAGLMGQHVMQGRGASEVIDELEELFQRHYQRFVQQQEEDDPT